MIILIGVSHVPDALRPIRSGRSHAHLSAPTSKQKDSDTMHKALCPVSLWGNFGKSAVSIGVPNTMRARQAQQLLMGHTTITVNSAEVHSIGYGWTDPPYMGDGPFQVEGRTVEYQ